MFGHTRFTFQSLEELQDTISALNLQIPVKKDISNLLEPITLFDKKLPNRLVVHPMEGFDANLDGSPGKLAFRRYQRFAEGGSGIIWFEATSVMSEARSNPRQLWLNEKTLPAFKALVENTRDSAIPKFGNSHQLLLILQITHSGRYSHPGKKRIPLGAAANPYLDSKDIEIKVLSDNELDKIQLHFLETTRLAKQAGFDGVDIKASHGYLINDLLGAFTRYDSRFGGSYDNRTRFLRDTIKLIRQNLMNFLIAVRLSLYDGIPFPYGFGVSKEDPCLPQFDEPLRLINSLLDSGCQLFNPSMGIPYRNPEYVRPFDRGLAGSKPPAEHPLYGVSRLIQGTALAQKKFPQVPFVGAGYSWLRHFWPYIGAGVLDQGHATFIGLGRSSFAYPDAPQDLLEKGVLSQKKVCITCSQCTELMRSGGRTGCVVRDKKIYSAEYKRIKKRGW